MRFIGRCYKNLNRFDEAEMWLKKSCIEAYYLRDPWVELALLYYLEKRYEKEIYLINDVNAAVVGYYASQNEYKSLAFLFQPIGRMAGSGIIVSGQLIRGMDHLAGEVALLPLNLLI